MRLYVIRHGEVIYNVMNVVNSINDSTLTENGISQAIEASKKIEKLDIDIVFCSPIKRCVETCEYVNVNNINVIYDDRLMERNAGAMQYEKVANLNLDEWYNKKLDKLYIDTEGFKSIVDRVSSFLNEIIQKYENKNVLLITHGDVCKAIYAYFIPDISTEDIILYNKSNCEIIKFDI